MKFHLNRNIDIRETGLVLQPKLFWLAASPDGLVSDKSNEDVRQIGLIEIKCPKSKKNSKISDLLHDQSFYVKYEDGVPVFKKRSSKRLLYTNTNGNGVFSNNIL